MSHQRIDASTGSRVGVVANSESMGVQGGVTAEPDAPSEAAPATPELTVAARSFGLLGLEGASLGLALWSLRKYERLPGYVTTNELSQSARSGAVRSAVVGVLLAALIGVALLVWKRPDGLARVQNLAYRCAPLALAMFLPLLFYWQLWVGRDLEFLVLASACVLGLRAALETSLKNAPAFQLERRLVLPAWAMRWLPIAAVSCGALAYGLYFAHHTINTHYRIETSVYDLGIENNLVWQAIHWGPLFRSTPLGGTMTHLGYHQTYFAYVLGIVYRFAPRPETLLVIQAFMLGFAALPLYFLAARRLGAQVACLLALLYLLYAPLHGSNLYDFHYQPLGVFFLWLTLYLLESRRDGWAVLAILLTLSVREDMSALLATLGGYLVLRGERPRAGLILAIVGSCYFVGLKLIIMPMLLEGESSYVNQYADLLPAGEASFGGVLKTALANPGFTLSVLLERDKLIYVLQLLAPLAFLSVRRPTSLLLLAPGFFFTLLSTRHYPSIHISFQYTAYWTPFVFIAAIEQLAHLRGGSTPRYRSWLLALCFAMLVTSYQHGAILQHNTARAHFIPYRFGVTAEDEQRRADLYALIAQIPDTARVVSAEWILPQVSSRDYTYALRDEVFDAEYMLISYDVREDELANIEHAFAAGSFGVVEERGLYVLAKRGYPLDKNASVLAKLKRR